MADSKRQSIAGKIATPNLKNASGKDVIDAESGLYRVVGSRIRITCAPANTVLEGTLFTACNLTNAIAINTASPSPNHSTPLASQPGDYHIIPFAHILSFEIIGSGDRTPDTTPGFYSALPNISKVDLAALQAREEQTIREIRKKDATRGKGVSKEAQELFDAIAKTLPARWAGNQIVVNDALLIVPPYQIENIKIPTDKKALGDGQVRKIMESFYSKRNGAGVGTVRTSIPVAMPMAPRKGG